MVFKYFLSIACLSLFSSMLPAQTGHTDYEAGWSKVDSLIDKKGLPQSALRLVETLYAAAKKEKNGAQTIRALVYRMSLQGITLEEPDLHEITELEKEIAAAQGPVRSILESLLARNYLDYFRNNRWNIYDRTKTVNFKKEDIAAWDAADFHKKIGELYLASIGEKSVLQQAKLGSFDPILIKGNTRYLRPTLFDLLAHQALDYFKGDEQDLNRPAYAFEIDDPLVFADAPDFASHPFSTADSLSLHVRALQLFQELIRMHLQDGRPDALLDVDIERLQFAYQYGVMENKEALYMNALNVLTARFDSLPAVAEAWYLRAEQYAARAARYRPLEDTVDRYAYLQARSICEKVIAEKDSSEGKSNCQVLLHNILRKELTLQTEKINVPGQPLRGFLGWRNFSTAYFRLLRVDRSIKESLGDNPWQDDYWKRLIRLPILKTFSQALPETGDDQLHRTEIKIDALPPGEYALLASTGEGFSLDSNALSIQYFYVSAIAYISHARDFFVLDRESGQPLSGATVQTWDQSYNSKTNRSVLVKAESYTCDRNGHFHLIRTSRNARVSAQKLEISIPGDHLFTEDYIPNYNYPYEMTEGDGSAADKAIYEQDNRRTFFFTDRSIYRPGQTIFFKGIVTSKDRDTRQSKVLPGFKTKTVLFNANNEKIDSVTLTTNAFGSFHGSFILPEHQLNGVFRLKEDSTTSQLSFSVEEYKRPKFYVEYDKLKGSYRVGDSIRVSGEAKAYAGNNIDGATVKYRVLRKARFPNYWEFWRGGIPNTNNQEIAHGETSTGANGGFTVTFRALPDRSIGRQPDPVFDYTISADITDINGETRSGATVVPVGYTILAIAIDLPSGDHLPADSLKALTIRTTNLSGEPEPAAAHIRIYKLRSPDRLIRQRYWDEPDQFVMSRSAYLDDFPHDEYSDETKKESWERTDEVFNASASPDSAAHEFDLQGAKLTEGWFLVEVKALDKYDQPVMARQYIELYGAATGRPVTPQYEWGSHQAETVEPGGKATVVSGSSAGPLFVIRKIDRSSDDPGQDSMLLSFYTLNKEKKQFAFPVTEADRGGFGISDAFVKDNRFYTIDHRVHVPWTNKQLSISYTSYRDKTLPGSKERWQVQIRGYKGDQVAAEVLAGMYDASLDQFEQHSWSKPALYPDYAMRYSWIDMNNFQAVGSIEKYRQDEPVESFEKQYDQLLAGPYDEGYDKGYMPFRGNRLGREMNFASREISGATLGVSVSGSGVPGIDRKVFIRGYASAGSGSGNPLYVIDGVIHAEKMKNINPDEIESMTILKDEAATSLYGAQGADGVIVIVTKTGALKNPRQEVQIRKNFAETAFFFPDLQTDSAGNASFSFTMPEALTQWKWMTLAHTKELAFGYSERSVITQKQLMVQPNAPRFLREGDRMDLSAKIVNLSRSPLKGQVTLQLTDPTTNQPVDSAFGNLQPWQSFSVAAGQSVSVRFPLEIPDGYDRPLTYRIMAHAAVRVGGDKEMRPEMETKDSSGMQSSAEMQSGYRVGDGGETFSDGEEATLPVLSNRMLVTESLPLDLPGDGTRRFRFDKLLQSGSSPTLRQHALTVEFTANPAWYAVQALPYIMEYPYECAEQTFNRFYANALAAMIVNSSPRIKAVFEKWRTIDTATLLSNLEKNQELKSVLLEETPWVLQGKSESQQKRNIALLFDMNRMSRELGSALAKLQDMQSPNGGFTWFKGGPDDRYITQYILTGIGHLQKLHAIPAGFSDKVRSMIDAALPYLDDRLKEDYEEMKRSNARMREAAQKGVSGASPDAIPGAMQVQYLYMRSFFADRGIPGGVFPAVNAYRKQLQASWLHLSRYMQGMGALSLYRTGDIFTARQIMTSIWQHAIRDTSDAGKGMYWADMEGGYYWYQSPIEMQSLLIEAFHEISPDAATDRELKTWLLRKKQAASWPTTRATADACYALLMDGGSWLDDERKVTIRLGDSTLSSLEEPGTVASTGQPGQHIRAEAGTGYFKKVYDGPQVDPSMGNITVTMSSQKSGSPAWGAVYWQYFERLDRIIPPDGRAVPLRLTKKLFIERNTDLGPVMEPLGEKDSLKSGDKVKIRIELQADRDLEYVHMKDMRASCMEPVNVLSQYKWQGGLGYYESTKDAGTDFFFSWLPRGTYIFEYPVFIGQAGDFSNGITSIECMYAPEFSFHSEGIRVHVKATAPQAIPDKSLK